MQKRSLFIETKNTLEACMLPVTSLFGRAFAVTIVIVVVKIIQFYSNVIVALYSAK